MTLVITEVSENYGCVVVGDSAVKIGAKVIFGAEKVQYSSTANIGFAIWGNACLGGQRIDAILSSFIDGLDNSATPRSAGRDLSALLRREGTADGRPWNKLRGGVHICGYQNSVPVLFHVHTGPDAPEPQKPFELYEDYPDASDGCHLRNGYYKIFGGLFTSMQQYAIHLSQLGFKWPMESTEDRVSYYEIMVNTVAKTLEAAGRVPAVGGNVSAFAFDRNGIRVDKRITRGTIDFCSQSTADAAEFSAQIT